MPVSRPFRALVCTVYEWYNNYSDLLPLNTAHSISLHGHSVGAYSFVRKGRTDLKAWAERFYNSDAWRACREGFLQTKGYLCERCSTPDDPVAAKIAHHKKYLTKDNINDPHVSLSWDNLEALCQDCHNKEHHNGARKKRYSFDANGNLVYPPMRRADVEGRTPRVDGKFYSAGAHITGVPVGGVVEPQERGRFCDNKERDHEGSENQERDCTFKAGFQRP